MVVQHNLLAMNSNRMLGLTSKSQAKSTEKLSSGYRINRAADDAAGLSISEKMRRQIRGLTQASANCQEGIGLVQTADGALNEMHDILQRVNELSVKSANGTNTEVDRQYIQQEVSQLKKEINRISNTTTFNEIYLFKRDPIVKIDADDYGEVPLDDTAVLGGKKYSHTKAMDFGKINDSNKDMLLDKSFSVDCSAGCSQTFTFKFVSGGGSSADISTGTSRPNITITVDLEEISSGAQITQKIYDLAHSKESDIKSITKKVGGVDVPELDDDGAVTTNGAGTYIGHANALARDDGKLIFFAVADGSSAEIRADQLAVNEERINIQAGAEAGQHIPINLYSINSNTLGIGDLDVSTVEGANKAITSVKNGLEGLSNYRSYYGATQNRLEHTIKNLDNVVENTTAAESLIRDTDMAKEMVKYSNNNILAQAGQSMLAQANQSKQGVLSLLQ